MHKLKIKIAGLYCVRCAEQIIAIVREHFKIKNIELEMINKIMTIYSNINIQKDRLAKEIEKNGYGPIVFLTKMRNIV